MQISKGVEWAAHAAVLLSALPTGRGLKAEALARYHSVPGPYMAKQMQALSKAGIVQTARGKHGGYRLARPAGEITLWDIMTAIEGSKSAFTCTEIRQNGPCGATPEQCRKKCAIAAAFHAAEVAFRESLQAISLVEIAAGVAADSPRKHLRNVGAWLEKEAVAIG
ncbi:RrF2 family transcriptional regulator [Parasphingopyxis lamellibrachiae]|uniref:BadM/Rrf2 family transcriptional regulator n=1 Tax=Parasphingopyxis lamellibrachiae TaxID=680125 RepID=A0A3D9FI18_9SPHN|nr:Rrf2 family transcriptional regulator [Parasphingopyxis lamellibrachiae]RED17288.1 BadM/Rrf2 family transcriptional regulator [Parasphingopyxis lamellibrachiae]